MNDEWEYTLTDEDRAVIEEAVKKSGWGTDDAYNQAAAEYVFEKLMNRSAGPFTIRTSTDGAGIWAYDDDPDDAVLVMVTGDYSKPVATFRLAGWIRAAEAKQPEYR